jgi:hypothetical protein
MALKLEDPLGSAPVSDAEQIRANNRKLEQAINAAPTLAQILAAVYPVGSIYVATVSTNPATLLGFGTWSAFGTGRTLVGIDAGQTEFDTVEETGGEKTHVLTIAELASHTHVQNSHNHTQDAHNHTTVSPFAGRPTRLRPGPGFVSRT